MVLFGLYMVPRKLSDIADIRFVLTMAIGTVVTTQLVRWVIFKSRPPALSSEGLWLSVSCGPLWTLGVLAFTLSVSRMGLALATPIKNTTAVIGTIIGLAGFAEAQHTAPFLAVAGSLLVVVTAAIVAHCGDRDKQRSDVSLGGILFAIAAAIMFASYTIPLKMAQARQVDTISIIAFMSLGTLGSSVVTFGLFDGNWRQWFGESLKQHLLAGSAGVIWAMATLLMTEAIGRIGLAVTWPICNLNTIVAMAAGIFVFGEIDIRKYWPAIALAVVCAILGSALLGLARA